MKDEIIAAVAQGWCTKENENKTMDSTLAMAIVDNVMVVIEKLEATIAKHERREDSHVKRIEELISSKGIRELEARLEEAEAHAQDFKDECDKLAAVADEIVNIINESTGVVGWHFNCDVAEWGYFADLVNALKEAGKLK